MLEKFQWLFRRKLSNALYEEKVVFVQRVRFKIRKINPLDYLAGTKAMRQSYDTYKSEKVQNAPLNIDMLKQTYIDVFLAAVIEPKLSRKPEEGSDAIPAEALVTNWDLATDLYGEIMTFTYGKKKYRQLLSHAKNLSS